MGEIVQTIQAVSSITDCIKPNVDTPRYLSNDEMDKLARTWIDMVIEQLMCPRHFENKKVN